MRIVHRTTGPRRITVILALVALATMFIAGCGGGGGGGGVAAAVGAGIDATVGRNPANTINSENVDDLTIAVDAPAQHGGNEMIQVTLTDGTNEVTAQAASIQGGGTVNVGPMDASALADGPIEVIVTAIHGENQAPESFGQILTKDTMLSPDPLAITIPATASNPADVVNSATSSAVSVDVSFDGASDATDLVSVTISDGTSSVESTQQNVVPGGVNSFTGFDLSALADGPLTITANLIDAAENTSNPSVPGSKDTQLPAMLVARVAAGTQNAQNQINQHTAHMVTVDVTLDATAVATDSVSLTLSDGTNQVSTPASAAPQGGGTMSFTGIDASSLADGSISMSVTVSDPALNSQITAGSTAQKDSQLNSLVSARITPGSGNAAGIVNSSNMSSVDVQVDWSSNLEIGDTVTVNLTQPDFFATSGPVVMTQRVASLLVSGIDCSAVKHGPVQIEVTLTDGQGNTNAAHGTPGFADIVAPAGHTALYVGTGPGNPQYVINQSSVANVTVEMNLHPDQWDDREMVVTLSDGTNQVQTAPISLPAGGGFFMVTGIDASSLNDGPISLSATYSDSHGNSFDDTHHTAATKDTQLATASAAFVPAGADNPMHFINLTSRSAVQCQVTLPADTNATDLFQVQFSDGVAMASTAALNGIAGGGTLTFPALDLSAFADGPVSITVTGTDPAQNQTVFAGTAATKDIVPPAAATGASVLPGPFNRPDEITAGSESQVSIELQTGSGTLATDRFSVSMISSTTTASSDVAGVAGQGSQTQVLHVDADHLPDGPVTVRVHMYDEAGNQTLSLGTPAIKDTSAVQPVSAIIPAGVSNPVGYINSMTEGAVTVDVSMPGTTLPTDSVEVRLAVGGGNVSSTQTAPGGAGVMTYVFDVSAFGDGPAGITVFVTSTNGNTSTFNGTPGIKDTVAPQAASGASLPEGPQNPAGWVNIATRPSATTEVEFGQGFEGTETADVRLTDGTSQTAAVQQGIPATGGTLAFTGLDTTGLADGSIQAEVTVTDAAWNTTTTSFGVGAKDTVAPPDAVDAYVQEGATNPQDVINSDSASAVEFVVETAAGATDCTIELEIAGPGVGIRPPAYHVQSPGNREVVATVDLTSAAEGNIPWSGFIIDTAGNEGRITLRNAFKDTIAPAAPTSAQVIAGASNPADWINSASQGSVMADVVFGATSVATDSAVLTIGGTLASASMPAPAGAGTLNFGPLDASGLADGTQTLSVTLTDQYGNSASYAGTPAEKDTVAPDTPTALQVVAGAGNAADWISMNSEAAVQIEATWPSTTTGLETVEVSLGATTAAPVAVPGGGGTQAFATIDASGEADGVIALSVVVTEPSGNTAPFVGTLPTKDTVPPADPTAAAIPVGASNPADTVNIANQNLVTIDITWPAGSNATDSAFAQFDDGTSTSDSAAQNVVPSSTMNFFVDASSLVDGGLTVRVFTTDEAGNQSTFVGTPAAKDTVAPEITAAFVRAGMNPQDFIMPLSETGVVMETTWGASADGTEMVTATFDDGTTQVVAGPTASPIGGGQLLLPAVNCAALLDGLLTTTVSASDPAGNTTDLLPNVRKLSENAAAQFLLVTSGSAGAVSSFSVSGGGLEAQVMTPGAGAPADVAVDPSGSHVYAPGGVAAAPAFDFDRASGSFASITATSQAGDTQLAFHPFLPFAFGTDPAADAIHVYDYDNATGALSLDSTTFAIGTGITTTVIDPSGRFAFALDTTGNQVEAFSIDPGTGALTQSNFVAAGTGPVAASCDARGHFLYVANQTSGDISIFSINQTDGSLTGIGTTAASGSPVSLAFAANPGYLYAANDGTSAVDAYQQDPDTGMLMAPAANAFAADPQWITVDPMSGMLFVLTDDSLHRMSIGGGGALTEDFVTMRSGTGERMSLVNGTASQALTMLSSHVVNGATDDIESYTVNDATGAFTAAGVPQATGTTPGFVVHHPAHGFVYAASGDNGTQAYTRDGGTSALTPLGAAHAGANPPAAMLMDPAGDNLLIARNTDQLDVLNLDGTGAITGNALEAAALPAGAADMTWRAGHDVHMLAVGSTAGVVETFTYTGPSGFASVDSVTTAAGANAIAVNPSGTHAFVTNGTANDVTLISIDAAGNLTAGASSAVGTAPVDVVVAPAGDFVYVLNNTTANISAFSFDGTSLTPIGTTAVGGDPQTLQMSPAGEFLWVVDANSGGTGMIHRFDVNTGTGALSGQVTSAAAGDGSAQMSLISGLQ